MKFLFKSLTFLLVVSAITGCGGDKKKISDPVDRATYDAYYPKSSKDASSFLQKATFGPKIEEVNLLGRSGNYEEWIDNQFTLPQTSLLQWAIDNAKPVEGVTFLDSDVNNWDNYEKTLIHLQRDGWWMISSNAPDQLRQRIATAFSEIFVISENTIKNKAYTLMDYYDMLGSHAFGNFENLLRDVTYHAAMGKYLSYMYNTKANLETGTLPDENYAREFLQLFTIGLYQLNIDGSIKRDSNGNALPTYVQGDIEELARVFTGLVLAPGNSSFERWNSPMTAKESNHDNGDKVIMGYNISGSDTISEINNTINIIFNHPNVGPFIAKQLIQKLTTSNPSAEYIAKVASAFNDNGQGVRGDMQAVIKTILLSPEAYAENNNVSTFGKIKEPLLFISQLLRTTNAFGGSSYVADGETGAKVYDYTSYNLKRIIDFLLQSNILHAPSVFNYYKPNDGPYNLASENIVAGEYEVFSLNIHYLLMSIATKNELYKEFGLRIDLDLNQYIDLIENKKFDKFVAYLDLLFLGGNLSEDSRILISKYVLENSDFDPETLVRDTIGLILVSPDYAFLK